MTDGHFSIYINKRYNPVFDVKYNGCVSRLKDKRVAFDELKRKIFIEKVDAKYGKSNDLVNAFVESINVPEQGTPRYLLNHILAYDKMADLEKIGISEYSRNYTTVISFTDGLNWILQNIVGSMSDEIPFIDQATSRAYLAQNDYLAGNITMDSISGLSTELDTMLEYIFKNLDCTAYTDYNKNEYKLDKTMTEEEKFSEILNTFIISYAKRVSRKIISDFYTDLRTRYGRSVLLNSEGIADIIIYSENKIDCVLDIIDENSKFVLEIPVKSYKTYEFIEDITTVNCSVRPIREDETFDKQQQQVVTNI